jgi:hypothetical protein
MPGKPKPVGKAEKVGKPVDGMQTWRVHMSDGSTVTVRIATRYSSPGALAKRTASYGDKEVR